LGDITVKRDGKPSADVERVGGCVCRPAASDHQGRGGALAVLRTLNKPFAPLTGVFQTAKSVC